MSKRMTPAEARALAWFFCWVFDRHIARQHNASYDVCPHWLCRLAYRLEKRLWYGEKG